MRKTICRMGFENTFFGFNRASSIFGFLANKQWWGGDPNLGNYGGKYNFLERHYFDD